MTGSSTKHVFHAFSAYVGQLTGQTTCWFWTDEPSKFGWDIKKAYLVDLAKTPSAARAGKIKWDEVEVDDHTINGGLTTIGPLFPGGGVIGGVWLHEAHMARIKLDASHKPQHAHDHELRCIVYNGDAKYADRRFQGFHARVVGSPAPAATGQVHRLQVWDAGHARASGNAPMWWIDLDEAADASESALGQHQQQAQQQQTGARAAPQEGSLYLDTSKRAVLFAGGGNGPKLPPAQGY